MLCNQFEMTVEVQQFRPGEPNGAGGDQVGRWHGDPESSQLASHFDGKFEYGSGEFKPVASRQI